MITKLSSVRASTAAFTRSTISCAGTTSLPGRWPQRLRLHLVFDVHAGGARLGERLHRARDVERAAPAGVRID